MIYEWLEPWFTTCPRYLREMGYLREMLGIRRRWRKYHAHWKPHCERSKQLVLQAVEQCSQFRKAVVVGSGWLHDVPLAALTERFAEVILVDVFHPFSVRRQVRRYKNVRLIAADITGVLHLLQEQAIPTAPAPTMFLDEPELDYLVSLNVLSQLPCMPEGVLLRRGASRGAVQELCRDLIVAHLAWLGKLPGVVSLIADVEVHNLDRAGKERSRVSTIYSVPFAYPGERWTWTLVPRQANYPYGPEQLQVVGVANLATAKSQDDRR
jgi:hypothetical protein